MFTKEAVNIDNLEIVSLCILFVKIRHIGIAVDSIEERLPMWESLGLKLDHTEEVESEGVTTAHIKVGGYEIELLEPMGKDTLVGKFVEKKGPGIHHLALEVDDIKESLAKAKKNGLEPIGEAPRPGADNTLVCLLYTSDAADD